MIRPDYVKTYKQPPNCDPIAESQLVEEGTTPNDPCHVDEVPYREDLADIPFPQ